MSFEKPTKNPCLRSWRITATGFAAKLIYPKNFKSFNVKFTLADCSPCFGNLPDKNQIVLSPLYFQRNLVGIKLDKLPYNIPEHIQNNIEKIISRFGGSNQSKIVQKLSKK